MSDSDFRATINFGDDKLIIDNQGAFYFANHNLRWSLPPDRAERAFDAALRSVQVFREVEGSGPVLTTLTPSEGSAQTAGGVEFVPLGGGTETPPPAPHSCELVCEEYGGMPPCPDCPHRLSPVNDCSCGLTTPCRCAWGACICGDGQVCRWCK